MTRQYGSIEGGDLGPATLSAANGAGPGKFTLVSVIIPTHERPTTLPRAVDSVLGQTHNNVELIIVDDASRTPVCSDESWGSRVTVLRLNSPMGPAAARNFGLSRAKGDYVTFLDDDDFYSPERVESSLASIGEKRLDIIRDNQHGPCFRGDLLAHLERRELPSLLQVMCRREGIPLFDERLRVAEDVDWWLQVMQGERECSWTERQGVQICRHETARARLDEVTRLRCRQLVAAKHEEWVPRRVRRLLYERVASSALKAGQRSDAGRAIVSAVWAMPSPRHMRLTAGLLSSVLVGRRGRAGG